jgi:hypothetical protein
MSETENAVIWNDLAMLRIKYGSEQIVRVITPDDFSRFVAHVETEYLAGTPTEARACIAAKLLEDVFEDMCSGKGELKHPADEVVVLLLHLISAVRPDIAEAIRARQLVLLVIHLRVEDGKLFWPAHIETVLDRDLVPPAGHPRIQFLGDEVA